MITTSNYFKRLKQIKVSTLPQALHEEYEYVKEVTENHTSWDYYHADSDIKKAVDQYLANLSSYLEDNPSTKTPRRVKPKVEKPQPRPLKKESVSSHDPEFVEKVSEEVRFIKRYALLHGKVKTEKQILTFINALQKAILEKRVRKTSKFHSEIKYIQENLINLYHKMRSPIEIKVNQEVLERFLTIGGSEKIRMSISYLKRYIGIQGKHIDKIKAQRLMNLIKNAVDKRQITAKDPYAERMNQVYESLKTFTHSAKKNDTLIVHSAVLNGINQSLGCAGCKNTCGCSVNGLDGIDSVPKQNVVMNSTEFAKMKFITLGFKDKWLNLIGDPCKGFTAMVFGKPKMGKSYLCIDFAGYLARNHGKVLYVAKEEKLDATLQKKLNDKDVTHPNLDVSDYIPEDLSKYSFVFFDSVNKLNLTPEELEELKVENQGVSFIYVFQTTKEGNFRGTNQFQHDVDVVIEIPEKGKAVQFGRFNQGGEINIFEESRNGYSGYGNVG